MKTTNPFKDLGLEYINRKSLFEDSSEEAKRLGLFAKLSYLKLFVRQDYDLTAIVKEYLHQKDGDILTNRLNAVISTFQHYTYEIKELPYDIPVNKPNLQTLHKVVREFSDLIIDFDTDVMLYQTVEDYANSGGSSANDWGIDLNADILPRLQKHDEQNGGDAIWSYCALYSYFEESLLPAIKVNRLPANSENPVLEMPAVQIWNVYLKKFFPVEDLDLLRVNNRLLKTRLLECAVYVIKVLWLGFPLFDEKVFMVRCNYKKDYNGKEIQRLYDENISSICIEDSETKDRQAYDALMNGADKYADTPPYVRGFVSLHREVQRNDVIVITSYMGVGVKIGLIKKETPVVVESFAQTADSPGFKLYCLQMKSAYCTPAVDHYQRMDLVDLTRFPLVNSIIPQQITISPVYKRKESVYAIYYGMPRKRELQFLADEDIERVCMEWLRSKFAPEDYRLAYQVTSVGGNYAGVDILGDNHKGERLAAQVSYTYDENLVRTKSEKLTATSGDLYIMFSMTRPVEKMAWGCRQINIDDVWNDMLSDSVYGKLIDELFK